MTGKKVTSVILNVQSSLAFVPFNSKFFTGLLLFGTSCLKLKEVTLRSVVFVKGYLHETIIHIFCECDLVKPLWLEIGNIFHLNSSLIVSCLTLNKILEFLTTSFWHIILCTKYFIYRCKFQDKKPDINSLKSFIKSQRKLNIILLREEVNCPFILRWSVFFNSLS